jgi:hypothetical protein
MGTSLTGLTPATTYDALIKVGDNGPLSATAKVLSDGLGNDSPLAMSTTFVGIGTTTPTAPLTVAGTSDLAWSATTSKLVISRSGVVARLQNYDTGSVSPIALQWDGGNVGIGTTSPTGNNLELFNDSTGGELRLSRNAGNQRGIVTFGRNNSGSFQTCAQIFSESDLGSGNNGLLRFVTTQGTGILQDRIRIDADGLKFGTDTAAANALDDYEEGTWTMGIAFGGGSTGITYVNNTGTYTKIGRQVTVNGFVYLTNKGSSTGGARITGLPFTIANNSSNYSAPSLNFASITFANQLQGLGDINATTIVLEEVSLLGTVTGITDADFANNSYIVLSFTYFV